MEPIQGDPSLYYQEQPQIPTEYEIQTQEYQCEPLQDTTGIPEDILVPTLEVYYNDNNQQEQYQPEPTNLPGNEPQGQQQVQPPLAPPPQVAQQAQQYHPQNLPPQPNPAYPTQPAYEPFQFLPQSPQMNLVNPNQPGTNPPSGPHIVPAQLSPSSYPPNVNQSQAFPSQVAPQAFHATQQAQLSQVNYAQPNGAQGYSPMLPFPHKPAGLGSVGAAMGFPEPNTYAPQVLLPLGTEGWKSGLFDCMNDPTNALVTAFFPCLTFGQIAEIVDNGHTLCGTSGLLYGLIACSIGLPCLMSCAYRTKLRSKYGLVEAPAPDWVTHFLCECCALCQEYRELQQRGMDPSIGWQGNMARNQTMEQQQQVAMMPPMNQRMMG